MISNKEQQSTEEPQMSQKRYWGIAISSGFLFLASSILLGLLHDYYRLDDDWTGYYVIFLFLLLIVYIPNKLDVSPIVALLSGSFFMGMLVLLIFYGRGFFLGI